jgi:CheY-like chemotaxis protein/HPt (histidine-containing phosphotransfer) domain-containing protein/anti-sigma regulatory factor (Ser/Thr protein kinase)
MLALGDLDARQRELVDVAMGSARALLAVIGDVLDFSKIEAGFVEVVPVTVAVGPLVADLAAQHRHAAAIRSLALGSHVDARLAAAHVVDAARLRQVLGNLVSNALKFTREGGVDLAVDVLDDGPGLQRLRFEVRDSGIGISDHDQARLFKPFTQASTDNARSSEGTGLGLAICRQLVEAMGGSIELSSATGTGTTVVVELALPVGAVDDLEPVPDAGRSFTGRRALPTREEALAEGTLVLLVEDNAVNRQVLGGQLEAIGFAVDTAEDAEQALARFASARYGVVFTDIQLPHIDGYELARRLRALDADTPILALTASALQGELARCRDAGMNDLVTKPTTMDALAGALRRWLPDAAWAGPAAAAAPVVTPAGVDRSALQELAAGDDALSAEILGAYADAVREDVEALSSAFGADDRPALRRCAHQIAGASRMVGAAMVAETAAQLEQLAPHGSDDDLEVLLHELRNALVAVMPVS